MLSRLKNSLLPDGTYRRLLYELLTIKLTKLTGIYPESFGSLLRRLRQKTPAITNQQLLLPSVAVITGIRNLKVTDSKEIRPEIIHEGGVNIIKSLKKDIILVINSNSRDSINLKNCLLNHLHHPDMHLICCAEKDSRILFYSYKRAFYHLLTRSGIFDNLKQLEALPYKTAGKINGVNVLMTLPCAA